ncbi:MAG: transcriptional repressor [Proteobacteria bacterium]|jgi:Fur family iron response transcriptional regulator|nr:transcriptional repressor [Pseudomonadota bacterium]MCG6934852.1 transcriptional repressor [Pseudomonadota bacterium]
MQSQKKSAIQPERDIGKQLRAVGITPTQQRVQIAEILFARPQHLSADQILASVNSLGTTASKATIYNTLGLFARRGLIREVIVDPVKVFYDSNTSTHHHFFNLDSGELTDIDADKVVVTNLPELPGDTQLEGIDIIFRVRSSHPHEEN